jgi:ABC-type transporter Mla subunit MlaD
MPNPIKDTIIFHRFKVMQVLYLILIFTLISCNPKTQTYVVTFDHVNGLEEGNPVILNWHKIGEVKNIAITDAYKIHVEIMLSDTL